MKMQNLLLVSLVCLVIILSVVTASAQPNSGNFLLQTGTPLAIDPNVDTYLLAGNGDLFAIKTGNTGSKKTEVHVLTAASKYQTFSLHTATALEESGNFKFGLAGNGDLFAIKTAQTGSGKIELYIISAAGNYQTFTARTVTPLKLEYTKFAYKFLVAPNRDLIGIKASDTSGGFYEVYTLSAASGYQESTLTATPISIDSLVDFAMGPGRELYAIKKADTESKSTEVSILSAQSNYRVILGRNATPLGEDTKNLYEFGLTKERNLFTVMKRETGSNSVEVHIVDMKSLLPLSIEATKSSDTPTTNPTGWKECAVEGEGAGPESLCAYEGKQQVSYGADGKWVQDTLPGAVICNNNTFGGDPVVGVQKKCYLKAPKPQITATSTPRPTVTTAATPNTTVANTTATNNSAAIPLPLDVNANGDNALIQAVRANDPARVKRVINYWLSLGQTLLADFSNARGETPLTIAADTRKTEILMILLSDGRGNVNAAVTRLFTAGDLQTLKTVAAKYPVNITTEMFESALTRQLYDLARFGLQHGVEANYALKTAIAKNIRQMIEPALSAGANADSALKFGMDRGDFAIASLALEKYGANADLGLSLAIPKNNLPIVHLALSRGANPTKGIAAAVNGGNAAIVTALLDAGADANAGLMPAVESNRRTLVELLILRGANPTPAMPFAVRSNDLSLVNMLLEKGANPNSPGLLAAAVSNSNTQIAEALISRGADPTSGMEAAVAANNLVMAKFLVERNARASDPQFIRRAAQNAAVGMVNFLLENGASPDDGLAGAIDGARAELVDLLIKKGANAKNAPLMARAGSAGNPAVVKLLLEAGAPVEAGMPEAVKTAAKFNKGTRVNASEVVVFDAEFYIAKWPDVKAAYGNNVEAARNHWIKWGAKECRQSSAMFSVLDYIERYPDLKAAYGTDCLAAMGHWNSKGKKENRDPSPGLKVEMPGFDPFKVVELLIEAGARAESPDYIVEACNTANVQLATLLLNHNAPKEAVDGLGQPLIHIAALTFNPEIITAILALGVDPNAKNRAGETALHIVARDEASDGYPKFKKKKKDRLPTLNALIAGKADVNAANARGELVLKVADGGDVRDILKAAGAVKDQKELDKRSPK